jgi:uncharacterized protein YndB with AHSA1/START domain
MTSPVETKFIYVTFIRTTPERLWSALTDPELMKTYWFGMTQESDWKIGASWRMISTDGTVTDAGEVLEADPPRRLAIRWRNEFRPELKAEGYSRCVYELEPVDGAVKLTITHGVDREGSKLVEAVSGGWPRILSNLKSWLETGEVVLKDR